MTNLLSVLPLELSLKGFFHVIVPGRFSLRTYRSGIYRLLHSAGRFGHQSQIMRLFPFPFLPFLSPPVFVTPVSFVVVRRTLVHKLPGPLHVEQS